MAGPADPARKALSRVLYEAKTVVARHPSLALPVARLRGHGVLVRPETDVLIEGYPRSANSFSVAAFGLAQPRAVEIAHHTHAPAHVIAAVRLGVPALVLLREPEEAALEFVLVRPTLSVHQVLRGYVRFYRTLVPYRDGFVVGRFPEVIADFGAVMRRLNERFDTDFVPFDHTLANEQACFEAMDGYWRGLVGPGEALERRVGRPSGVREAMKDELRPAFLAPALSALRAEAERIYRSFPAPEES